MKRDYLPGMIALLVTILIILIVCGVLYWVVGLLPLPAPAKQVAMVVIVLIGLLWFLQAVGLFGSPWRVPIGIR